MPWIQHSQHEEWQHHSQPLPSHWIILSILHSVCKLMGQQREQYAVTKQPGYRCCTTTLSQGGEITNTPVWSNKDRQKEKDSDREMEHTETDNRYCTHRDTDESVGAYIQLQNKLKDRRNRNLR